MPKTETSTSHMLELYCNGELVWAMNEPHDDDVIAIYEFMEERCKGRAVQPVPWEDMFRGMGYPYPQKRPALKKEEGPMHSNESKGCVNERPTIPCPPPPKAQG